MVLGDRRVAWGLAGLFFAVGVEAVWSGRYLHDEGLLTYYFASFVRQEPLAALFLQKVRPAIAAFYAPVSLLGFRAFAVLHVAVCALSLPMIAAIARRFGMTWSNVPALVMATSPLLLMAAPGGHTNADAVVALVLGLWLHVVARRPVLSGAVFAAALLIRSEAAVFVLAFAAERAWARDARWWTGLLAVPLGYALAGALYHRDLLWMLHFPPTLLAPAPQTEWVPDAGALAARLRATAISLLCLSPVFGLALLARLKGARREEWAFAGALVAFVLAIRGFPLVGLFNFDESPRYLLVALPALALLVGRQVEAARTARESPRQVGLVLGALAVLGSLLALGENADRTLLVAVAAWALVVALGARERPAIGVAVWAALALAAFPVLRSQTWLMPPARDLEALATWWRAGQPGREGPVPVVTNFLLARAWLEHEHVLDEARTPVHVLLQHDTAFELERLLNARVGQHERIYAAMDREFFGRPIRAGAQRDVDAWPEGTLVIWIDNKRLNRTIDRPSWDARMQTLERTDRLVIGRLGPKRPDLAPPPISEF